MRPPPATIVLCSLALAWGGLQTAWGHAFPQRADPPAGAAVAVAPTLVRIWFDAALEPALLGRLRLQTARGQPIDHGEGQVDARDATLLTVHLPLLAPGTYRVLWSVVARDGHRTEGTYTFTIQPGP
jgi:methionine-rich copper-binding protein CopC